MALMSANQNSFIYWTDRGINSFKLSIHEEYEADLLTVVSKYETIFDFFGFIDT